jgi:hypothetical protein
VECMICNITGCICYGSENFGLSSLHDDYVGFAGATLNFYSVAPNRFEYRFNKVKKICSQIFSLLLLYSEDPGFNPEYPTLLLRTFVLFLSRPITRI